MSSPKTKKQLLAPAPLSRTADCERLLSPQSPPATEKLDLVGLQIRARDRFFFVYAVFLLFGVATLLPWNIFLNATDYFIDYKLNTAESYNAQYRKNFTFITGMIGQVTNIAINIMNVFVACGGDPKKRVPWAIVVSSSVVLLQILLAAVNSESWPGTFFVLCCVSVFIMYVATGILQSCVFFVASILPMEYTNSVILGSSLAGVFTSVMSILTKASSPDPKSAAIFYFFSAFVALASALGGYFLMHKTKFYRAFEALARTSTKCTTSSLSAPRPPYWAIFKKTWLVLFCIWLNLFSTLCIFPVYLLGVQPNNPDFLKFAGVSWFHDIVTFLTFNVAVAIGNVMPRFFRRPGPKFILFPVIARACLVLLFFAFCNFKPSERTLPVLVSSDWVYWVLGCAISPLAFGYFTSLLMMYAPRQVEPQHAGTAAMLASLALVVGVTTGLNFVLVYEKLVLWKW